MSKAAQARTWLVVPQLNTILKFAILVLLALAVALPNRIVEAQSFPDPFAPVFCYGLTGKHSAIDAYGGYLWGYSDIRFYDGDNYLTAPGRKEILWNNPVFGAQFETFPMRDLAIRGQAWINWPREEYRSDFLFSRNFTAGAAGPRIARSWDSKALVGGIGASLVYHLGMGGTPYTSGVVLGYRYNRFNFGSQAFSPPGGDFQDKLRIHIPHLGVYYAHGNLLSSVMRFDLLASPVTLALYNSERRVEPNGPTPGSVMTIDGHSFLGAWYEALFQWSWKATNDLLLGFRVKYNYLELSGAAKIDTDYGTRFTSTAFSMDSRHHFCTLSLSASYTF